MTRPGDHLRARAGVEERDAPGGQRHYAARVLREVADQLDALPAEPVGMVESAAVCDALRRAREQGDSK